MFPEIVCRCNSCSKVALRLFVDAIYAAPSVVFFRILAFVVYNPLYLIHTFLFAIGNSNL